jgi:tetratricopeptide (TPR) repeat protein
LEKALSDLSSKGEDKGAKGAFVRLKLALLDFQSDNFNSAKSNAFKALDMLRAGGTYVPYETGFLLYEVAWQFDNYWDYTDGVLLHQKALDVWPKERPNYRSDVVADIGFEYNRLKRFDKAESAYKEALNQTLRTQGDSSSNVWRYAQLGQAQIGQKKYMEAEINLNAALGMENRLHRDRKTTHRAQIYTDLGRVKAARGDMKSAQDYFEKSEEILKRKKYESYYYLINQLELANLYRDTGHPEKARPLYGDLLRRLDAGDSGPDRKDVNRELDLLLAQTGGR